MLLLDFRIVRLPLLRLIRSARSGTRHAYPIVLRRYSKRLLLGGASGAGEDVNVLTDDPIANVCGLKSLCSPGSRQGRDLHLRAGWND